MQFAAVDDQRLRTGTLDRNSALRQTTRQGLLIQRLADDLNLTLGDDMSPTLESWRRLLRWTAPVWDVDHETAALLGHCVHLLLCRWRPLLGHHRAGWELRLLDLHNVWLRLDDLLLHLHLSALVVLLLLLLVYLGHGDRHGDYISALRWWRA